MKPSLPAALLSLSLAFSAGGLARAQDDPDKKPTAPNFGMLRMPQPKPGDPPPSGSDQMAAAAAPGFNDKVAKAQKKAEEKHDPSIVTQAVSAALPALNAIAEKADLDPRVREQISVYNLKTNDYGEAKRLSDTTLSKNPDDRDALADRAAAHYGLGDYRRAIADATRAAEVDPNNGSAYTTRALAHYQNGEYLEASEDAKRALALDKNNETAYATLRLAEGRIRPASISLDGQGLAQAQQVKREFQSMQEQRNQLEELAQTPSPVDRAGDSMNRQASTKIAIKDYWGGIAEASKAVEADPRNYQALYLRAAAYNLVGEPAKAAADASASLALAPGNAAAYDARAKAFLALGKFKEALADANRSIELNPNNPYAWANRAQAEERLEDIPGMLADYQKAASMSPQFETAYRDAAAAHAMPLGRISPLTPLPREDAALTRTRHFRIVVASSVVGGLLIAVGVLHILSGQINRKITSAVRGLAAAQTPAGQTPPSQALLERYEILGTIGRGGMGLVYDARDKALGRAVAIKRMRDEIRLDARERERFLQEARTVAALHHPSIVDIHTIVDDGSELYLVFEKVSGRTVDELLAEKGRLSLAEAKGILRGVCEALEFAHGRGVVHRDLKPSNIMMTDEGRAKVMDFGIARRAKDSLGKFTATNTVVGTPLYMAPEAEQGVVRKESDVYSLGACLYEMVTGERPFAGPRTTAAKLAMSFERPSRVRQGLPPALDALIESALRPDPDKRVRSPAEFLGMLEAV